MRGWFGERGSSTVELALVMPLLLLTLVGAVQFAVLSHAQDVAATAVEEGARLAASDGASLEDGTARTQEVLQAGLGATGTGFSVNAQDTGETITMQANGQYRLLIPWAAGQSVPINVGSAVRKEGFRSGP